MKFNPSFQKILDIKEYEKQQQTLAFNMIKKKEIELESKLQELKGKKEKAIENHQLIQKMTVLDMIQFHQEMEYLDKEIEKIQQQQKKIMREAEEQHELLIDKMKETKIWNQLKEKSLTALQHEIHRAEQSALDEIAILNYAR